MIGRLPTPVQCSTVFARVEIRLARVNPGKKKNAKFLNRLLKKERLGTTRAKPVTNKKRDHYVVIVEKVINVCPNSLSLTAMESVWSVSKLSTESIGSRHELVANSCLLPTRLNSFVVSASAVCIGH